MTLRNRKAALALLPASLALLAPAFAPVPAQAGFLHRHPAAAGVGAGLLAHHMAKHAHHGFMHRHPIMTGVAAGMAAHHFMKKH